MKTRCASRARDELSRILSVQVQNMVKDFSESAEDLYEPETQSAVEYFSTVSRQVTDNVITGSQQVAMWRNDMDGSMFMLMKLPMDTVVEKFTVEMKKALKRKEAAEKLKFKTDDALKDLDKALEKTAETYTNKPANELNK